MIRRPCPIAFMLAGIFQFLQGSSGTRNMVHSRRFFLFFMQSHGRDIYFTAQRTSKRKDGPREERKRVILLESPVRFQLVEANDRSRWYKHVTRNLTTKTPRGVLCFFRPPCIYNESTMSDQIQMQLRAHNDMNLLQTLRTRD